MNSLSSNKDVQIEEQMSSPLFKLNKHVLNFEIIQPSLQQSITSNITEQKKDLPQCILKLQNVSSSSFILFKIQIKKSKYFQVTPTCAFIPPKGTQDVFFIYYSKDGIELTNNKIKIKGFEVKEEETKKNPKLVYEDYVQSQRKVRGNVYKIDSVLNNEETINQIDSLKEGLRDEPESMGTNTTTKGGNDVNQINKAQKEQLEKLKLEYYQLKHQLNIGFDKYTKIKQIVDAEKKTNIPNSGNLLSKLIYIYIIFLDDIEVNKANEVSLIKAIIACVLAIMLGYYLGK